MDSGLDPLGLFLLFILIYGAVLAAAGLVLCWLTWGWSLAGGESVPMTGPQRLASDVSALAAMGWPSRLSQLPDGQICLRLTVGSRDGLPVETYVVFPGEYPDRPPEVIVARGRQRVPLDLPGLVKWNGQGALGDIMEEVMLQLPILEVIPWLRLTPEGDLA